MCISELGLSIREQLVLCAAACEQRDVLSLPDGFDDVHARLQILAVRDGCTYDASTFCGMLSRCFVSWHRTYSYEPVSNGGGIPEVKQLVHRSIGLTVDGWVMLHELVREWLKHNTTVDACT